MKKVLVIKGESRYNVLRKATELVEIGFANKGYEVYIYDLRYPEQKDECTEMILEQKTLEKYDFVFSFQGL